MEYPKLLVGESYNNYGTGQEHTCTLEYQDLLKKSVAPIFKWLFPQSGSRPQYKSDQLASELVNTTASCFCFQSGRLRGGLGLLRVPRAATISDSTCQWLTILLFT